MLHSMSCEYPEGCSCGASQIEALHEEIRQLNATIGFLQAEFEKETDVTSALRTQVAELKADNEALDKEDDITGACLRKAADEGDRMRAALDITLAALDDIHISAHCIAKAGPFGTPTLDKAWPQFMELAVKATNAIHQARQAREGNS